MGKPQENAVYEIAKWVAWIALAVLVIYCLQFWLT